MSSKPVILFTAFEPSGDEHAAPVIAAIRRVRPDVDVYALGGAKMEAAGATLIERTVDQAAMGAGAIGKIREHRGIRRRFAAWLSGHDVAVHVPTDSPAANWALCKMTKRRGAKVAHLVAPQVWAWASWRVRRLQKWSDHVMCLLPFEPAWFAQHGVKATFIGHPLFDHPIDSESLSWESVSLESGRPRVALLPGSRPGEIAANWPIMAETYRTLAERYPDLHAVVAAADDAAAEQLRKLGLAPTSRLRMVTGRMEAALHWAEVVLTVSGTASLHVARHGRPMVILYRANPLTWHLIGRWLINTRTFTLPNLIAAGGPQRDTGGHIVHEFVPKLNDDAGEVTAEMISLIDDAEKRQRQITALHDVTQQFAGHDAGAEAARVIMGLMGNDE